MATYIYNIKFSQNATENILKTLSLFCLFSELHSDFHTDAKFHVFNHFIFQKKIRLTHYLKITETA